MIDLIALILFTMAMSIFFVKIGDDLADFLGARADEIKRKNELAEKVTEEEAFERIAYLYPAEPEEIESVLDDYYSGELIEKRFYLKAINENERLLKDWN